jgi:hypothetical protein
MRKMSLFLWIISLALLCVKLNAAYGDYQLVTMWGSYGSGEGQFYQPFGIAVDADRYVYVADEGNSRIQKFDSSGSFIATWGSYGTGNGQFDFPSGIAVDADGYVYVADTYNDRIQKFDSWGTFIATWGSRGEGNGQFVNPFGIAVATDGFVYVADTTMCRIQKFDSSGTFVTKWGSYGVQEGQFGNPYGIAVDNQGDVYVADTQNCRIQKFDSSGVFLTTWGDCNEELSLPYDVAVNADGYVYVLDTLGEHIDKYVETGSCAVSFLLDTEQEKINLIRKLKDRILTSTREGNKYVRLFYEHSPEIISIMKHNPAIRETAYELLQTSFSYVLSRLIGNSVIVAPGFIAEIEKLCDAVSIKASPSLKKDINRVKADLKGGELLKKFGIEVAKP